MTFDPQSSEGGLSSRQHALFAALMKQRGASPTGREERKLHPAPADRHIPFPLTEVQQAYAAGRSSDFDLGNIATHGYQEFEVNGLDPLQYQSAWERLIKRHDALRTVFREDGLQEVLESVPRYALPVLDLRELPQAECNAALEAVREEMSHQVLPLGRWPMFDVRMTLLEGGITRLHFSFDALLMDGSSFPVLMNDIRWLYEHPGEELPPLSATFRDYVLALRENEQSRTFRDDMAYWQERLPSIAPAPEFTLRKELSAVSRPRFVRLHDPWTEERWAKLEKRATERGLTATTALLAAFSEVLRFWNRHASFSLNVSFFNRQNLHPEIGKIIGDFTDLMVLSVEYLPGTTLQERARHLQERFWEDMEHRSVSGVRIIRDLIRSRGGAGGAIMPVVFTNLLKVGDISEGTSLGGHPFILRHSISQTPQVLIDLHVYRYGNVIGINWDTVKEVFPHGQLTEMFSSFCALLGRMAEDDQVWNERNVISLPEDQSQRRLTANATETPLPEGLLHAFVAEGSRTNPEQPAIICPGITLTHRELQDKARSLGHLLRKKGASPNTLVAIVMEKGWEQIVAALGILEAGAAYLPVDPDFPSERIRHILTHGETRFVLTQSRIAAGLSLPEGLEIILVDLLEADTGLAPLPPVQSKDDLAYVIYTSGSTGLPKGVMISHKAALNTVLDINRRFAVLSRDRMLCLSDLNFDLSVYDIFGLLAAGGAVVLPAPDKTREPAHWQHLLENHQVTLWNTVPMLLQMLIAHAGTSLSPEKHPLRLALLSGDWIPLDLPGKFAAIWPKALLAALGGATEAAIWSNLHIIQELDPDWKSIPYGLPLSNQHYHILNEALEECPDLVPGHLHIAGKGLAEGYWKDEEKSKAAFFRHPTTGERLYRTGDMGRWLPDGIIEFLGRTDSQVKVGGYRIELGEIETAMCQCEGVAEAVASVVGDGPHTKRIISYIVPCDKKSPPAAATIQESLRERLPRYMVPAVIIILESLPLLPNGKVNRKALVPPDDTGISAHAEPHDGPERDIAEEWRSALGLEQVGRYDNFFELGGNSLIAVQTLAMLKNRYSTEVSLRGLFDAPTVAALAALVSEQSKHTHDTTEEGYI